MKSFSLLCGIALLALQFAAATASPRRPLPGTARCVNVWDEGCINGQLEGAGRDDDFVNGDFSPGKRCVNMRDEGCVNGQLENAGRDGDFVNGGLNPGKRARSHVVRAASGVNAAAVDVSASRVYAAWAAARNCVMPH